MEALEKAEILDFIKQAKAQVLKSYRDNLNILSEKYNKENTTAKSYHGRQLLELIQNADDQNSEEILINFNEEAGFISVSNYGPKPFSSKGYNSLFYTEMSEKKGGNFIGHMGLGLRSLLMWGEEFKIISNGIELTFSQKLAQKEMNDMLASYPEFKKAYDAHIKSYPNTNFPTFSCPSISDTVTVKDAESFTTTLYIKYKQNENIIRSIREQIDMLSSEILLFLPNIKSIRFAGIDKTDIVCEKQEKRKGIGNGIICTEVHIDSKKWQVFESNETVTTADPNDGSSKQTRLQVKLALPEDGRSGGTLADSLLYSFFPTKISIKAPYLLHATFELDPTRNSINESEINEIVAKHLAGLIIEVARHITGLKRKPGWLPLKMLSLSLSNNPSLSRVGFQEWLKKAIQEKEVFPCHDGKYRKASEVTYISEEFSRLICELKGKEAFPSMLIPDYEGLLQTFNISISRAIPDIEERISNLNLDKCSFRKRAELIKLVAEKFPKNNFALFIDSDSKKVGMGVTVFSPIDKTVYIPSFCKIRIIHKDLYEELKKQFNASGHISRNLAQALSSMNFTAYEPRPLVSRIIEETEKITRRADAKELVKKSVRTLFRNYRERIITEETNIPKNLPLPDSNGNFVQANNLFLSEEYPSGKIAKEIFEEIEGWAYTASPADLGFEESDNLAEFEKFLIWLGVNKFVKYQSEKVYTKDALEYLDTDSEVKSITILSIHEFDKVLSRLDNIEEVLLWIHSDERLRDLLKDKEGGHEVKFLSRTVEHPVYKDCSYVKYEFNKKKAKFNLSSYVLEESFQWANKVKVDFSSEKLQKHSISRRTAEGYMMLLGAKESLEDLSSEAIVDILTSMTDNAYFRNGRGSQSVYARILNALKDRDTKDIVPDDYKVFASEGKEIKPFSNTECYFSERIDLPSQLRSFYPIFNFPHRAGGAKAIEVFKINDLTEVNIELTRTEESVHQKRFCEMLDKMKPLLLAVRFSAVSEEKPRMADIGALRNIQICLCSDIAFRAKDKEGSLDDYNYIFSDKTYYIKVNDSSFEVRRDKDRFCRCLANVICSALRITDVAPFELILSKEKENAKEWVISTYGEDVLNDVHRALGKDDPKTAFRKVIESLAGQDISCELSDLDIDYENICSIANIDILKELFCKLGIEIEQYNISPLVQDEIELSEYHRDQIRQLFAKKEMKFKTILWAYLSQKEDDLKKTFTDLIKRYTNYFEGTDVEKYEFKHSFVCDYEKIWENYVSEYSSETSEPAVTWDDILKIHSENLKAIEAKGYSANNLDAEQNSLIFFKGADIDNLFLEEQSMAISAEIPSHDDVDEDDEIQICWDTKFEGAISGESHGYTSSDKAYKVKISKGVNDKKLGDEAEEKVYKVLVKEYGKDNVVWRSKEDDGAHYDIQYTPEGSLKFVEVKSFTRGNFTLSKDEYAFGVKNSKDYEIWLVDKNRIYPIKNFFDAEGNPTCSAAIKSYEFTIKLK